MKRIRIPFKMIGLLLVVLSLFACEPARLLYPEEVKSVALVWIPNKELRSLRMEIDLDEAIKNIFVDKLSASSEIEPIWVTGLQLIEGSYEITVTKKDGTSEFYALGGDSVLYSPSAKKYYQNKDLHLFVYQILFREFVKRKIRLQ
ncbi:MAG: hypothetical protein JXD23_00230 [Spirochaetales bacterium]|nr:hypothetical protein [Spirochaetales bacterium]